MLEDDAERIERFEATLRSIDSEMTLRVWRCAHSMIREAGRYLGSAGLISLDHDLEPEPGMPDPGDGVMVAKWLVSQPVIRPVIVHSSNGERARWMAGEFDLAGWRHWRAVPFGERWVEVHWRQLVHEVLQQPQD